jgi:hypothetical protein
MLRRPIPILCENTNFDTRWRTTVKGRTTEKVKPGAYVRLRKLWISDTSMSTPDLVKALTREGFKVSPNAVSTTLANCRALVLALQEAGKLKRRLIV